MSKAIVVACGLIVIAFSAAVATDLPEIKFEKYTLENGLDVILHEDHSIPMVAVNIWYHVGSKNEVKGRTGFAHLFEHMMFQGSEHIQGEYFTPLEEIGGQVNGSTSEDRTNFWENVPSNYLELALWLESDRMGYLLGAMDQEKLDNQRDVVKNERRQGVDNQPYGTSGEIELKLMYPDDHPYSWPVIGSMEDLSAASLDDVGNFFKQYYTPNNASLVIAGDFEPEQAKQLVNKYFANLMPGPEIQRMTRWVPKLDDIKRATIEDDVELARLDYIWHTPAFYDPGDAEFDLLANILSTGKTSRLYKALVYEQEIAQNVVAYQASAELSSTFRIQVMARQGHTLEAIEQAVDAELRRLLTEGITPSELEQAKTTWEATYVRGLENVGGFGGRADVLNRYNTFLGGPGYLAWDMERYSKATIESVMKYAREYIDLDKRGIMRIVPQGMLVASDNVIDRSTKPTEMPEPSFSPPEIQQATLTNGLRILLVEDHKLPLIQMNLVLKSGWSADAAGKFGAAALTADMLNEGTKSRVALEIADEAKKLGAILTTGSYFDGSNVNLNSLTKNIDPSLELMADIALNPTFPEEELERLRKTYLGQIAQEGKQPFTAALKSFAEALYGKDHAYSQSYTGYGNEESINALTRADLVDYYKANYFPNNAAITIAGDITLAEARKKIERVFGKWEQGTVIVHELTAPPTPTEPVIYVIDKQNAEQSAIIAGNVAMARTDPDYLAFQVMNQALGGQFVSRINMNLREDKGYTYGAGSFVRAGRYDAPFITYAPVHTEFTKESVVEIVSELRGVSQDHPLTAEELEFAKSSLIKGFPQGFQTYGGIAGGLNTLVLYDLPLDGWSTYVDRVAAVDEATASRVASKFIRPESLVIIVVGDRVRIEEDLKNLNIGRVEGIGTGASLDKIEKLNSAE
ncbi:MAG: pitrilysin family protein [Candidatus Zixiibacteriota bacterium]